MHRELAGVQQMLDEDVHLEDIEMSIEADIHLPDNACRGLSLSARPEATRHERRRAVGDLSARTADARGAQQPQVIRERNNTPTWIRTRRGLRFRLTRRAR
jgi:hypothetical protein